MKVFILPRVDPFKGAVPRYVAYCVAHGAHSADEQQRKDRARWGDRWMLSFTMWLAGEARRWCKETGFPSAASMSWAEHNAFNEWLAARYPIPRAAPAHKQVHRVANG